MLNMFIFFLCQFVNYPAFSVLSYFEMWKQCQLGIWGFKADKFIVIRIFHHARIIDITDVLDELTTISFSKWMQDRDKRVSQLWLASNDTEGHKLWFFRIV
jgi:hypothetical protein